jgi:hypothetical protein
MSEVLATPLQELIDMPRSRVIHSGAKLAAHVCRHHQANGVDCNAGRKQSAAPRFVFFEPVHQNTGHPLIGIDGPSHSPNV